MAWSFAGLREDSDAHAGRSGEEERMKIAARSAYAGES